MNVLDLFSGIGGMSLGLEWAGMRTVAFCECGTTQRTVLGWHWPGVPVFPDATKTTDIISGVGARVDVIAGGDPCPIRSRARSNGDSKHPDLSGYFLALVGRLWPRWVVRENVPAPDDAEFATALGVLGYRTCIVRTDAAEVTGQSRQRDFIVGCREAAGGRFARFIQDFEDGPGAYATKLGERPVIPALTTNRTRYDSRDCYIWEEGRPLRILDSDERTSFAGFPAGWLDGLSEAACATVCGNAVVPHIAEIIGRSIMAAEQCS